MESWQERTDELVTVSQRGNTLKPVVLQAVNFNRAILSVDNPIFCHAVLSIKLSLNQKIAAPVFHPGRRDFDHKIQCTREFLAGNNLIPTLIKHEGEVGNHRIVITEDRSGAWNNHADWISFKIF